MTVMNRRQVLRVASGAVGILAFSPALAGELRFVQPSRLRFTHGVASGDPTADGFILWTRVTPESPFESELEVGWQVATRPDFARDSVVSADMVTIRAEQDFTLKVDVQGLESGRSYFYRFLTGDGKMSEVGRARTLPTGRLNRLSFGVFSCANYPSGYFHAYKAGSQELDVDFVLHLGDYIYEYGRGEYGAEDEDTLDRLLEPPHELLNLDDYRQRYSQSRRDPDLQALHRRMTMIPVWDDHEIANDAYRSGADNHSDDEGSYEQRLQAARHAYFEWMPIRGRPDEPIYRSFEFGDLCHLIMLETRIHGRVKPLDPRDYLDEDQRIQWDPLLEATGDPERTLLGTDQFEWLLAELSRSPCRWQVLGGQVLMGRMEGPEWLVSQLLKKDLQREEDDSEGIFRKVPYNFDAWDGYKVERDRLVDAIAARQLRVIHLAGDTHNAWCSEITTTDGKPGLVEFATPSVTSPGIETYLDQPSKAILRSFERVLTSVVSGLKYANLEHRGYLKITIDPDKVQGRWRFIKDIKSRTFEALGKDKVLQVSYQRPGKVKGVR